MTSTDDLIDLFKAIGLSEAKAKDTAKNANLSKNLEEAIIEAKNVDGNISPTQGMLLYHVASKIKPQIRHHLPFLSKYVSENKLNNELRVNTALEYLLQNAKDKTVDIKAFNEACGVGIGESYERFVRLWNTSTSPKVKIQIFKLLYYF